MTLTARRWPLMSPLRARARQVWPKWPHPTSFPSSYLAAKWRS
uniref:Uncharacterized protein n=1 Tax=Arundo donax TaxID=35708 RepID=A0A0A9FND0_ARUDO